MSDEAAPATDVFADVPSDPLAGEPEPTPLTDPDGGGPVTVASPAEAGEAPLGGYSPSEGDPEPGTEEAEVPVDPEDAEQPEVPAELAAEQPPEPSLPDPEPEADLGTPDPNDPEGLDPTEVGAPELVDDEPEPEVTTAVEETAEEAETEVPETEVPSAPPPDPTPPEAVTGSRKRTYLIFEEIKGGNFKPCGEVDARNGENALRAAYRKVCQDREVPDDEFPSYNLVVVSSRMWRPKPIRGRQRNAPPAIEIG